MNRILLLMLIASCFLVHGCKYDKYEDLHPIVAKKTVKIPDSVIISYSKDVVPILQVNCYTCHSAATASGSGQGFVLETYSAISAFTTPHDTTCQLIRSITWNNGGNTSLNMPSPGGQKISDSSIAVITKWIKQGAQNN